MSDRLQRASTMNEEQAGQRDSQYRLSETFDEDGRETPERSDDDDEDNDTKQRRREA